jgi:predicted ATPase
MYIKSLEIKNLRSFESANLEFNLPTREEGRLTNVNVLLGDNGLGKTTVLRAVALSILGPLLSGSSGFVPEGLVRRPPSVGKGVKAAGKLRIASVKTHLETKSDWYLSHRKFRFPAELILETKIRPLGTAERLEWTIEPERQRSTVEKLQFDDEVASFFIVGYGATRRVESSARVDESARAKARLRRYERVAGLFEDHLGLMPLSFWLPEFGEKHPALYRQVHDLINNLLPENCKIDSKPVSTSQGTEHLFIMSGVPLPFRALSDGYRAYIGWIGDMLYHMCMGVASSLKLIDLCGIVLVDEIDLHLHPEWQRIVVPTLARALPNIQFIVTTHSPLVVGSLESSNLFVLSQENGTTAISRLPEKVHGKSAEQILLSPYFGLESTRAPGTASELARLAREAVGGNPKAATEYLELLAERDHIEAEEQQPAPPRKRAANLITDSSTPKTNIKSRK